MGIDGRAGWLRFGDFWAGGACEIWELGGRAGRARFGDLLKSTLEICPDCN